jgi:hypothetical protein
MKIAVFWVIAPCSAIALMMEAARTSETLVNFYQTTRCYNPEDSNVHKVLTLSKKKNMGRRTEKFTLDPTGTVPGPLSTEHHAQTPFFSYSFRITSLL